MKIQVVGLLAGLALATSVGVAFAADLAVAPADKDGLVNVAKGNLEELKLSEVAQTAGSNASVKTFAKTMLDAHTKMMKELSDFASARKVSLPSKLDATGEKDLSELRGKKGAEFDAEYKKMAIGGHKKVLGLLDNLCKSSNGDVKTFAEGAAPKVKHHLEMAEGMQVGK